MDKAKSVSVTTRTTYVFTEDEIEKMLFDKIGVEKTFQDKCEFDVSGGGYLRNVVITVERSETTQEADE